MTSAVAQRLGSAKGCVHCWNDLNSFQKVSIMSAGGHTSDVRVSVRTRRTMKIAHNFSYSITMGPCQPSGNIFPDSIGRRRGSIGSSSDAKSKIEVCTTADFGVFVLSPPLKKNTLRYSFLVFAQKGQRFKNCSNSHVNFQKHVGMNLHV